MEGRLLRDIIAIAGNAWRDLNVASSFISPRKLTKEGEGSLYRLTAFLFLDLWTWFSTMVFFFFFFNLKEKRLGLF